jgi:hypothetical protein
MAVTAALSLSALLGGSNLLAAPTSIFKPKPTPRPTPNLTVRNQRNLDALKRRQQMDAERRRKLEQMNAEKRKHRDQINAERRKHRDQVNQTELQRRNARNLELQRQRDARLRASHQHPKVAPRPITSARSTVDVYAMQGGIAPIAGATIRVASGPATATRVTDRSGHVRIDLPTGSYTIVATAPRSMAGWVAGPQRVSLVANRTSQVRFIFTKR